jgi:hypothetical protein
LFDEPFEMRQIAAGPSEIIRRNIRESLSSQLVAAISGGQSAGG